MTEDTKIAEMSYEEAFAELEAVVESLEEGDLPLERALEQFQRGQALAARCSQLLEQAELKLKRMIEDDLEMPSLGEASAEG